MWTVELIDQRLMEIRTQEMKALETLGYCRGTRDVLTQLRETIKHEEEPEEIEQ